MLSYIKTVPVLALLSLLPLSALHAEDFGDDEMSGSESSEMGDSSGDESTNSGMDADFGGSGDSGMGDDGMGQDDGSGGLDSQHDDSEGYGNDPQDQPAHKPSLLSRAKNSALGAGAANALRSGKRLAGGVTKGFVGGMTGHQALDGESATQYMSRLGGAAAAGGAGAFGRSAANKFRNAKANKKQKAQARKMRRAEKRSNSKLSHRNSRKQSSKIVTHRSGSKQKRASRSSMSGSAAF